MLQDLLREMEQNVEEAEIRARNKAEGTNVPPPAHARPNTRLRKTVEDVRYAQENPEIQEIIDIVMDTFR